MVFADKAAFNGSGTGQHAVKGLHGVIDHSQPMACRRGKLGR